MTPSRRAAETAETLEALSRVFDRASKAMAQERLQNAMDWTRFLADSEQWCRVTEDGIEIIPTDARRIDQ